MKSFVPKVKVLNTTDMKRGLFGDIHKLKHSDCLELEKNLVDSLRNISLRKYFLPRVQSSTEQNTQQFCIVELKFENKKV